MRKILALSILLLLPALLLTGCGSGSSGSAASGSASSGSQSSGSGGGSSSTPPAPTNTVAITVDGGPAALQQAQQIALNTAYVTVTVCVPGSTTQCQSIDHISVDTGSYGLRIISSVLDSSIASALPAQMTTSGQPLFECVDFADGYTFGPVVTADLTIGSETAASVPINIMGSASNPPTVPSACISGAAGQGEEDDVVDFGANGVLGVGTFVQDCGLGCAQAAVSGFYYTCSTAGDCTPSVATLAQQVSNPVASFATDNNGVALQLPPIGDNGAATVNGTLIFGIGTQSNNMPASGVAVLTADGNGNFTTTYNGTTYKQSFIDSGSNGYFFNDTTITACPTGNDAIASGFFCPTSTLNLSATNTGNVPDSNSVTGTGPTSTVNFMIANAVNLFQGNPQPTALDNVGGTLGGSSLNNSFDFGLPFFFGRTIYFALEGANTSVGTGPYYAY